MDEGRKDMSRRATAFLIWRAGESVNWECTAQDIADELGITRTNVSRVCLEKGWRLQYGGKGSNNGMINRTGIDTLMEKPWLGKVGRT
jgi:hypothetical protein